MKHFRFNQMLFVFFNTIVTVHVADGAGEIAGSARRLPGSGE